MNLVQQVVDSDTRSHSALISHFNEPDQSIEDRQPTMPARWKILVSNIYMQPAIHRFIPLLEASGCEVIIPEVRERLEEKDLLQMVADIDGVIAGDDCFTERVLLAAPRLRIISKWGTGIDSIDQVAAKRLGIIVSNTPNAFSEPVGDSIMGYILCFARNLPWMDRSMRQGLWEKTMGHALHETTLGVIGVGNVGKALLRRAKAFGMRLMGNDIRPIDKAFLMEVGLEIVERDQLLQSCDFVSLNCDLNPTSYHLIDEAALNRMKTNAVLINTSRGSVVDQVALVKALREGRIRGAALDVFEDEPLALESPLLSMDNVMLAPHNANSSPSCWERVHHNTIHNLLLGLGVTPE